MPDDTNPEELLDELNKLEGAWQAAKDTPKNSLVPDGTYRLIVTAHTLKKNPGTGTLRYSIKVSVNMPQSPWHGKSFWHKWFLTENTMVYVRRDFGYMGFTIHHASEIMSLNPKGAEFDAFVSAEEWESKNEPADPQTGQPVIRRGNCIKYFKEQRGAGPKGAQAAQAQAGGGSQQPAQPQPQAHEEDDPF